MTAEDIRNRQNALNKEAIKIAEEVLYTERQTVISGISASMDKKIADSTEQYINVRLESSQFKTKLDVLYKSIEERLNKLGYNVRVVSDDRWSTIIFEVDWSVDVRTSTDKNGLVDFYNGLSYESRLYIGIMIGLGLGYLILQLF